MSYNVKQLTFTNLYYSKNISRQKQLPYSFKLPIGKLNRQLLMPSNIKHN